MAGFRTFATGEVLTAANVNNFLMQQSVMVFADAAARTAALDGILVEGMLTYNLDTKALEVFDGAAFGPVVTAKEKRVDAFTGSGTFTVPAGVTYAIAHMLGGGGGIGTELTGGNGGDSSVAFASGTVTGKGAQKGRGGTSTSGDVTAGPANSGLGVNAGSDASIYSAKDAIFVAAGAAVTPAEEIAVVVGAGGAAGSGADAATGGTGYVYIEYFEEV